MPEYAGHGLFVRQCAQKSLLFNNDEMSISTVSAKKAVQAMAPVPNKQPYKIGVGNPH
ncbi:hypothetical protein D3C71_1414460 [compost metagenome]